ELEELQKERKGMVRAAREEAARIVRDARQTVEGLLAKAGKSSTPAETPKAIGQVRESLRELEEESTAEAVAMQEEAQPPPENWQLAIGAWAWLPIAQEHGRIISLDRNRAELDVNGRKFEVDARALEPPRKRDPG